MFIPAEESQATAWAGENPFMRLEPSKAIPRSGRRFGRNVLLAIIGAGFGRIQDRPSQWPGPLRS